MAMVSYVPCPVIINQKKYIKSPPPAPSLPRKVGLNRRVQIIGITLQNFDTNIFSSIGETLHFGQDGLLDFVFGRGWRFALFVGRFQNSLL